MIENVVSSLYLNHPSPKFGESGSFAGKIVVIPSAHIEMRQEALKVFSVKVLRLNKDFLQDDPTRAQIPTNPNIKSCQSRGSWPLIQQTAK